MGAIEEIKQRLDIVEFIGNYVHLQKAGRSYKGLCPFHNEKTPSFIVFPENQGWHCFGACGVGGDIFSFVMRRENMDFSEALRFLAERAGVALHPFDETALQERNELERLRAVNVAAAQFYHRLLLSAPQGEAARRYLERRGVTRETIATFQLGYAPDEWHAVEEHLQREHHAAEDVLAAGLTTSGESGNVYDRFRGRLMFPIRDMQGHVIGFGGRVLDDSQPKYLNTPQTVLFDKGSVLYGIDLTHRNIRQAGTAVIVEGYMDVILPYQCGVTNLVACMGTALSEEHISVLKRLAKRLILALDPDAAGVRAVERGVETARQNMERKMVPVPTATGLVRYEEQLAGEIRVLTLPDGLDPDELILRDRARWDTLVAEALPVAEYFFHTVLQGADLVTAKGKRAAAERLLPVIAAMDNAVERTHYLQRLAQRLHMEEGELRPALEALRTAAKKSAAAKPAPSRPPQRDDEAPPPSAPEALTRTVDAPTRRATPPLLGQEGLEERCLALLLLAPSLLPEAQALAGLTAETFADVRNRQVFEALVALAGQGEVSLETLCATLDTDLHARVESLYQQLRIGPPLSPEMAQESLLGCTMRLRRNYLSRLNLELRFMVQDAQEQGLEYVNDYYEPITRLTHEIQLIDQRIHAFTYEGRRKKR